MKTSSYKDLIVWQKSIPLTTEIYKLTKTFPKDELYGLVSQMRRCAVGIASNIAEGYARQSRKEYLQFLFIARGSAAELETQLLIAYQLKYMNETRYKNVLAMLEEVSKILSAIISKLR